MLVTIPQLGALLAGGGAWAPPSRLLLLRRRHSTVAPPTSPSETPCTLCQARPHATPPLTRRSRLQRDPPVIWYSNRSQRGPSLCERASHWPLLSACGTHVRTHWMRCSARAHAVWTAVERLCREDDMWALAFDWAGPARTGGGDRVSL